LNIYFANPISKNEIQQIFENELKSKTLFNVLRNSVPIIKFLGK